MTDSENQHPSRGMSVVPGPDEPRRRWQNTDPFLARMDLELLIMASKSTSAVAKLILGTDDLTQDEIITLGELNFRCWLQGYEPAILLFSEMPVQWYAPFDQILDDRLISRILRNAGMEQD